MCYARDMYENVENKWSKTVRRTFLCNLAVVLLTLAILSIWHDWGAILVIAAVMFFLFVTSLVVVVSGILALQAGGMKWSAWICYLINVLVAVLLTFWFFVGRHN